MSFTEDFYKEMLAQQRQSHRSIFGYEPQSLPDDFMRMMRGEPDETPEQSNAKTLTLIKKSIKEINAEAVSQETSTKVRAKIDRLLDLGLLAQAEILEAELLLRQKLNRMTEWDYKILPFDSIKQFEIDHKMTATRDGLAVHIDTLEKYIGTKNGAEAKDKIVPDNVLGELSSAKERKLFDTFSILWVEKVPDPLLLGQINGCKDYFLIAEWGDDIKFDDIVKEK